MTGSSTGQNGSGDDGNPNPPTSGVLPAGPSADVHGQGAPPETFHRDDDGRPQNLTISDRFVHFLGTLGAMVRKRVWFLLIMLGTSWGVLRESLRSNTWRRTVRYEFQQTLATVAGRGLLSTVVMGALTGVGVVSQAIYWLGFAGMAKMTGSVLVTVIVRELAPILVGILMLGRSGMLSLAEVGMMTTGGQVRSMQAEGLDPFLLLVVPRTLAFTVAGFTLGIMFSLSSLTTGYVISRASGALSNSLLSFYYDVVTAMTSADYLLIPLKFIVVGFLVGLGCCIGGLTASNEDSIATMLPRGFTRGMLIVMTVSVLFSLKL
ncbi:MlaE family ABC transporter permease [Acetobacter conturbans]|uniref:MlaE family ABC transporter permease n=1 Tax=Acetobacter conturbans TaxID=1737472 RepID=UPI0030CC376E